MQVELDNLRRDAELMRAVLDKAAAGVAQPQGERSKLVPKSPVAPARKPVREVTQISAFDTIEEEQVAPAPSAPVPAARPVVAPVEEAMTEEAPAEEKKPKKGGKKDAKPKSHIGNMFDLLTFSDV